MISHHMMNENDQQTVKIAATFFVTIFLISGLMKVRYFGANNESEIFAKKSGVCMKNSQRIVFLGGLVQLYASFLILRGVWSSKMSLKDVKMGSFILAVFTVLATLIFYVIPGFRPYAVLSNLSVIGGLLLLPLVCELRH